MIKEERLNMKNKIYSYSEQELLDILVKYNNEVGFPTQRKFIRSNGLPSYTTYFNKFGSFKNAILLSGIEIPHNKKRYFNREEYDEEYLIEVFKEQVDISIKEKGELINDTDFDTNVHLPSAGVYYKHFKTLDNLYHLIGIDRNKFNNDKLESDMRNKYIELRNILGRTPHSRDFDRYSKNNVYWYSCRAYLNHFGSIQNLQKQMGDNVIFLGRDITKQAMLDGLLKLCNELECRPTRQDVDKCEYLPNSSHYRKHFGSYANALYLLGFKQNNKVIITPNGNKALSGYEYRFLLMLEKYNINFTKEEYYNEYIKDFDKKYRFDFTLNINKEKYFVEIFGIERNDNYSKKINDKIKICSDNNLKLIDIYSYDMSNKCTDDLYLYIMKRIEEIQQRRD